MVKTNLGEICECGLYKKLLNLMDGNLRIINENNEIKNEKHLTETKLEFNISI